MFRPLAATAGPDRSANASYIQYPELLDRDAQDVIPALFAGIARGRVLEQIPATSAGMTVASP
jgi:hypothetical protein